MHLEPLLVHDRQYKEVKREEKEKEECKVFFWVKSVNEPHRLSTGHLCKSREKKSE